MKKTFTNSIKALSLLLFLIIAAGSKAQCTAGFTYVLGANGTATFNSTSAPLTGSSIFNWSFGVGSFTTITNPTVTSVATTFTANGI